MNWKSISVVAAILLLAGCGGDSAAVQTSTAGGAKPPAAAPTTPVRGKAPASAATQANGAEGDDVAVERAKLSPEDRALVKAQEWCAVNNEGRLGSMGVPVKLTIKGKPVFLCCGGCKRKAEADPDKTLAKVEELKRQKSSQAPKSAP